MSWVLIKDAPPDTPGHVWGPQCGDRTDMRGCVYAYPDGCRNVSCSDALGYEFTHWHPFPSPPNAPVTHGLIHDQASEDLK